MLEQNLAALFRGFATEIESHRTSLTSIGPEADDLIKALDDLTAFLIEQAQILERRTKGRQGDGSSVLTKPQKGDENPTNEEIDEQTPQGQSLLPTLVIKTERRI